MKYYNLYDFASINKTLTSVTIELTTKCNWRCKHCYIEDYDKNSKLSLKVLDKLFKELRQLGVVSILFTGGEIFTRKDIIDILKLARGYFFKVTLFSNLSLANENQIKQIKELYIDKVSCTLFSMDSEIHDNITQRKGSLEKTLANLSLFKKYNVPVQVKHIITNLNPYEYKKIHEYCNKMGFKFLATVSIFPKRDGDTSPLRLRVSKDYLYENLNNIDSYRSFTGFDRSEDIYICNSTRFSLSILANGDVQPCTNLHKTIGNILTDSIISIWNDSEILKNIQDFHWSDLQKCTSCKTNKYCYRCSGISLSENNTLFGCNSSEYLCSDIRKKLTDEGKRHIIGELHKNMC